jgi:sec-independent protein translocase protein TatA
MGFPNIGPGELILILIIALVVLGPGKLPDVAASLGKSVREFRRAATDVSEAGKLDAAAQPPSRAAATTGADHAAAAPSAPAPSAPAPTESPAAEPSAGETPASGSTPTGAPARDPNLS